MERRLIPRSALTCGVGSNQSLLIHIKIHIGGCEFETKVLYGQLNKSWKNSNFLSQKKSTWILKLLVWILMWNDSNETLDQIWSEIHQTASDFLSCNREDLFMIRKNRVSSRTILLAIPWINISVVRIQIYISKYQMLRKLHFLLCL